MNYQEVLKLNLCTCSGEVCNIPLSHGFYMNILLAHLTIVALSRSQGVISNSVSFNMSPASQEQSAQRINRGSQRIWRKSESTGSSSLSLALHKPTLAPLICLFTPLHCKGVELTLSTLPKTLQAPQVPCLQKSKTGCQEQSSETFLSF